MEIPKKYYIVLVREESIKGVSPHKIFDCGESLDFLPRPDDYIRHLVSIRSEEVVKMEAGLISDLEVTIQECGTKKMRKKWISDIFPDIYGSKFRKG